MSLPHYINYCSHKKIFIFSNVKFFSHSILSFFFLSSFFHSILSPPRPLPPLTTYYLLYLLFFTYFNIATSLSIILIFLILVIFIDFLQLKMDFDLFSLLTPTIFNTPISFIELCSNFG